MDLSEKGRDYGYEGKGWRKLINVRSKGVHLEGKDCGLLVKGKNKRGGRGAFAGPREGMMDTTLNNNGK